MGIAESKRGGKHMTTHENTSMNTHGTPQLGEINITTSVLETIAAQATKKVAGVYVSKQSFQNVSGSFFSLEREKTGAKIKRQDNHIAVDIDIRVKYGYSVPDVAMNVQESVKEQILFMTDLVIDEVNVHVISVEAEPTGSELFHLDEENGDTVDE